MDYEPARRLGDFLKDKNIILKGADLATAMGFTQVPNFLLKSTKLSSGDKIAFAMLLSYAWQNDFCFPGQERLAEDLGLSDRSVRTNLKSLERNGLLTIRRRGLGKTNVYELDLKPPGFRAGANRKKTSGLDRKRTTATERKETSDPL
jgi:DNA-binding transcriptional ArsR family regulator